MKTLDFTFKLFFHYFEIKAEILGKYFITDSIKFVRIKSKVKSVRKRNFIYLY